MTTTQTDKKMMQMEAYHDELMHELAQQSKRVHRTELPLTSKGLFDTSKSKMQNFLHKPSSSK